MPTLYRPDVVSYRLPSGAYRTPDGQRVTSKTPGAVRHKGKSPTWWGRYTDGAGQEHQVKLSRSKETARRMLNKLAGDGELASVGIVDTYAEHRGRSLQEHLEDFEAELRTRPHGKAKRLPSAKQLALKTGRIRRVLEGCGLEMPGDLAEPRVLARVQDLLQKLEASKAPVLPEDMESFTLAEVAAVLGVKRASVNPLVRRHRLAAEGDGKARRYPRATVEALLVRKSPGLGSSTSGYYAREIKAFTRWLARRDRIPKDPLLDLRGAGTQSAHRHDRRALSEDELRRLLAVAQDSTVVFRGMTGRDRRHVYLCAMVTGFRASELGCLTPAVFDLETKLPTIYLRGDQTKNGEAAQQPLPLEVAAALRDYLAGRDPRKPIWPGTWTDKGAEMLRIDLDAAGIPYMVQGPDGPLYADFHALRHSYVALLDHADVSVRDAMQLARHSDPKLTLARYGKPQLHNLAAAIERLPSLLSGAGPERKQA